ncbi:MAG TPA: penicillin-binding protein 1C, partial [Bacteroidales bacterium]|nr:penicillin-binding protein 1C [Bacteroidales bacterium]
MKKSFLLILTAVTGLTVLLLILTPDPVGRSPLSLVLLDRNDQLLGARLASDGQWRFAPSDQLPHKYRTALLAYEDRRFYRHPGIDPLALLRAVAQNIRAGKIVSGGSTISMQLARLSAAYGQRSFRNKLAEAWLALKIELKYRKSSILRHYAAVAPFGGNIAGVDAASWRYFGHPPELLSWAEAAMLAILPNAPSAMHPGKNQQLLLEKRNRLLHKLHRQKHISQTDLQLALAEPLPTARFAFPDLAPHYLESLRSTGKTGTIRSTLEAAIQQHVLLLAQNHLQHMAPAFIHNVALIVRHNADNEILAYVGNVPPETKVPGCYNDMARTMRSPGSILKPLLYAAALDQGLIHTESLLADVPRWWGSYSPRNFDNRFNGAVPASVALQRSLNVPFAGLLTDYGIEAFRLKLRQLGFSGFEKSAGHYGISLILGGAEINLVELTDVYARMAQKALNPDADFGLSQAACRLTAETLTGLNRPETETTLFPESGELQLAWKTGTSFGFRDAWALGFNP